VRKYYTLNSDELGEEAEADTLVGIYKEWQRYKQDDKEMHDHKTYYIRKHEVENNTDMVTDGKVYRRGNKVFFKAN